MQKIGLNKRELKNRCFHRFCENKPVFVEFMISYGMPLVVALCQDHADEWIDATYEKSAKDFIEDIKKKNLKKRILTTKKGLNENSSENKADSEKIEELEKKLWNKVKVQDDLFFKELIDFDVHEDKENDFVVDVQLFVRGSSLFLSIGNISLDWELSDLMEVKG